MPNKLKDRFREVFDLSPEARATLAGLLIESLESAPEPDAEATWLQEAQRRWEEIERGETETIPWEDVRARLFGGS